MICNEYLWVQKVHIIIFSFLYPGGWMADICHAETDARKESKIKCVCPHQYANAYEILK